MHKHTSTQSKLSPKEPPAPSSPTRRLALSRQPLSLCRASTKATWEKLDMKQTCLCALLRMARRKGYHVFGRPEVTSEKEKAWLHEMLEGSTWSFAEQDFKM
ncbi:uncharacterized protein LOC119572147 [Penaeus monodon]|uniref:uncharacterized protein LOC119572147 n=1 Tax=Penaeus monodon TaxID=6687 RepID=UPI0018A776D7|nr:uncharacterized protein LOC119572147 [Penaeus monodon]